jgi:putative nucleotidyltransferase with HDIG domain
MITSATKLPGKIYLFCGPFVAVALWLLLLFRMPLENFHLIWIQVLVFLLLTIGAGLSPVKLPRGGVVTIAFALDYAGLLIFGPVLSAGIAAISIPFVLRNTRPFQRFWNAGMILITMLAAGYVYQWAGGEFIYRQTDFTFKQNIHYGTVVSLLALLMGGIVYVLTNTFAVALAISFSKGRHPLGIWMVSFRWMAGQFLAVAPFGILMALIYLKYPDTPESQQLARLIALALFFIPLLLARWAFQGSMGMLEIYNQTIQALSNALEAYDPYTRNHSERVTRIAEAIAKQMHLSETKLDALSAAARLHDMGKCRYDWESIIRKPGRPTDREWEVIRSHPMDGAQIAAEMQVALLPEIANIVRAHHERMDGSGYPQGLKGEQIDLAARILCVADSFEAITSRRSYQNVRNTHEALAELRRCAGTQFDINVIDALEQVLLHDEEALVYIGENQVVQA